MGDEDRVVLGPGPAADVPCRADRGVQVVAVPADDPATVALQVEQQAEIVVRYGDPGVGAPPVTADGLVALLRLDVDEEPAGCVAVRDGVDEHGPGPGTAELKRLYVRPAHRGRGLSRLLLAAAEDAARAAGVPRLLLETGTQQPEAMALYASAGWEPVPSYGQWADHPMTRCFGKLVGPAAPIG